MRSFIYNLQLFKEIFFPRHCAVCQQEIDTGLVCEECRKSYSFNKTSLYGANRKSWQELVTVGQPLEAEDIFDRVELLYRYEGAYKEALHKLKFECEAGLLPLLREEVALGLADVQTSLSKHYDLITCIPTSEERRLQRGFDVPWELFGELKASKHYTDKLLKRVKGTAPLYTMAVEERRSELAGCFAVINTEVVGKRILLCDDIYTTGSTTKEAAQVLLQAGAKSVGVLAFCASKDNWN